MVPPFFVTTSLFLLQRDDRMRRLRIELGGVGLVQPENVARELNGRDLHSEAKAQVGHLVLARILGGKDFSFDAALAETAGNQNAAQPFSTVSGPWRSMSSASSLTISTPQSFAMPP